MTKGSTLLADQTGGSRALKRMRYAVTGTVTQKPEAIDTMREQTGCFVLITNVPMAGPSDGADSDIHYDGKKVLQAYREQNGIEHNFSFLEDPRLRRGDQLRVPQKCRRIEVLALSS